MLTVQQVCERLGINKADTVYGFIHSGELKAVNIARNISGRPCWRISEDDLEAFILARTNRPPEPTTRRRKRRRDDNVTEYF